VEGGGLKNGHSAPISDGHDGPQGASRSGASDLGEGFWLVLGGGGLKGMAHIGAWKALAEEGLVPSGIVGTSIGALIGALAASGMPPDEMRRRALAIGRTDIVRVNRRAVWINGVRQPSVFRGDVLRDCFEGLLPPEGWDALSMPVLINAVDLGSGETVWLGTSERIDVSLVDAVYASAALPVFYPPFEVDGLALVDGGVADTLAFQKAFASGAPRVVAVDVGTDGPADSAEVLAGGMVAIHQRVVGIMTMHRRAARVAAWNGPPLLRVRPNLTGYGTFDFEHVEYFLDEGYRAMKEALAAG